MRKMPPLLLLALACCSSHAPPPVSGTAAPALAAWEPSLHLADASLDGGAPAIALRVADELLAAHPREVPALLRRGRALAALGRTREAEVAYRQAVAVQPDSIDALLALGRIRVPQDPAEAETIFARVVAIDAHNAAALNDLGIARDLQAHHAAAQDAYRQALAAAPTSAAAQVNLGLSLALSGRAPDAVAMLQPLALEPGATPRIRQDLAVALSLSGRNEEAASMLARDLPPGQVSETMAGFQALLP
jgi:Flp pilus assembly protein TadD